MSLNLLHVKMNEKIKTEREIQQDDSWHVQSYRWKHSNRIYFCYKFFSVHSHSITRFLWMFYENKRFVCITRVTKDMMSLCTCNNLNARTDWIFAQLIDFKQIQTDSLEVMMNSFENVTEVFLWKFVFNKPNQLNPNKNYTTSIRLRSHSNILA